MAFISLGSKLWGTGPDTTLNFSYEKQRSGADMKYRIKISVEPLPYSESYFGYPIYMKTSLAGTVVDTHTVKSASPGQWSSAITYTTGWFTVSNKTSGTTALSLNVYSGNGNSRNKTYSYSLAVDPAGSALGTISNFTIGNAIDIPITKYDSSFTDTLEISVGGTIVKTISGITSGYDVSFTSSELSTIYSKIPNVTSATFTFKLTTKSGSTTVGTSTKTATGTIASTVKPTISSVTVSEAGSVPSSWGVYVKNKSKLKFVVSGSAGSGSSISSVKTTINGSTYSGSTITTNLITTSGNLTATITIIDSRGRSTSTTKTIVILDYADPYITSARAYRCDIDGNANDNGSYLRFYLKAGGYSLSSKNTFSYKVEYKKVTDTSYISKTFSSTSASLDAYSNAFSGIETGSSYNVRIVVSDYFKTVTRELPIVPSVFRTMNFKTGGRGVAFGKIAEEDDVLDIDFYVKFRKGIINITTDVEFETGRIIDGKKEYGKRKSVSKLPNSANNVVIDFGILNSAVTITRGPEGYIEGERDISNIPYSYTGQPDVYHYISKATTNVTVTIRVTGDMSTFSATETIYYTKN